jgi:hypothetical protein
VARQAFRTLVFLRMDVLESNVIFGFSGLEKRKAKCQTKWRKIAGKIVVSYFPFEIVWALTTSRATTRGHNALLYVVVPKRQNDNFDAPCTKSFSEALGNASTAS